MGVGTGAARGAPASWSGDSSDASSTEVGPIPDITVAELAPALARPHRRGRSVVVGVPLRAGHAPADARVLDPSLDLSAQGSRSAHVGDPAGARPGQGGDGHDPERRVRRRRDRSHARRAVRDDDARVRSRSCARRVHRRRARDDARDRQSGVDVRVAPRVARRVRRALGAVRDDVGRADGSLRQGAWRASACRPRPVGSTTSMSRPTRSTSTSPSTTWSPVSSSRSPISHGEVLFGALALAEVEGRFSAHLLDRWDVGAFVVAVRTDAATDRVLARRRSWRCSVATHGERRTPSVPCRRARGGTRRPTRPAHPHAVARPDSRQRLGLRHRSPVPAGPLRHLVAQVRLARAGAEVQSLAALPHRHRRAADPLHSRPLRQRRRVAVDHHSRLAGLRRRIPRHHRTAARRLPRRRAVAARVRLVGCHDASGLGRAARRGDVGEADGAPRLRPLRRAGRRLGRDGVGAACRDRRRAHGRAPLEHAARVPRRRERRSSSPTTRWPTSPPRASS